MMFDLAAVHSQQFYDDPGVGTVFTVISSNTDLRTNIGIVKALAFKIGDGQTIFDRLEPLLNEIGNELRNKRNRFVHDLWLVSNADRIVRIEMGTRLSRVPGSGERVLELSKHEEFTSLSEIDAVALQVHGARVQLLNFSDELQEFYRQRYPEEE